MDELTYFNNQRNNIPLGTITITTY